jgi:hypothetical protein
MRSQLNRPALILLAAILLLLLVLVAVEPSAVRTIVAVLMVLFVPGFALTFILFERGDLGTPERILLSVALSVAITALIGLLLNWTPWGLQPTTLWTALLLGLALEVAVIVFTRRRKRVEAARLRVDVNFTARQWVLMGLAALVTLTAIRVASTPAPEQGLDGYTVLWVQPTEMPDTIRLGVDSEEFKPTKFQLKFEINGVVREGQTLELNPGESWEGMFRLPNDLMAGSPLTVSLYRLDNPTEVYRHVVWWPPAP